jgi:TonB-linked SusC/RagA family outer membrane protein
LNSYSGFSEVFNVPDMMNSEELIEYTKDSRNRNYINKYDPLNPESANYNPDYNPNTNAGRPSDTFVLIPDKYVDWDGTDTDWLDLIFQNGPVNNTNISVSGGGEGVGYYISGGYFNQLGVIEGSAYERYTMSGRINAQLSEKLNIGVNFNTLQGLHNRVPANAPYFGSPPGIVYSALVHSPVINPYNADGTLNQLDNQSHLGGGTTSASNPLAIIEGVDEEINTQRTFGNFTADYQISDNLSYRSMLGVDRTSYARAYYRANSLLYRTATEGEPFGQSTNGRAVNWLWENTVNYKNSFGAHNLDIIAGYTAQKEINDLSNVVASNFPDDEVTTLSGGMVTDGSSIREEWSLVSMLTRINYNYNYKYLLSAAVRSDRSSRFGEANQTGVFPSVSVAWRASEENIIKSMDLFSELKFRTSYGVTGNFLIPNYGSIGLLQQGLYPIGSSPEAAVFPYTLSNANLGWENTKQVNAGFDFGFAGDRIYGSFDIYNSDTENLLLEVSIPSATGFTTALTNIGKVNNSGMEFNITSRNIVSSFSWTTDFNISKNINKVIALGPGDEPILSAGAAGIRHITRVGDPIGSYYGYVVEGIYQNSADIANSPIDEMAPNPQPGDFKFKDVNGDGVINENDRTVLGSYHPDFIWGVTNRFNFGGFDASIFVQGVEGREILNLTARHLKNGEANFNSYAILNERWISEDEPGNGEIPRADRQTDLHGNNNRPSSYQVEDGSYVRIKNITLGYTLNPLIIQQYASSVRIYGSVNNLAIWTDYLGFNPEVSLQSTNMLVQGEDYGAYPLSRTYSVGINISF